MDGTEGTESLRRREVIKSLLDSGEIGHPTSVAVARILLEKGTAALRGKQRHVHDNFIEPKLATKTCSVCGVDLWPDQSFVRIGRDGDICCPHHLR